MPKIDVYNIEGKKVNDVELKEDIFGIIPNEELVHITWQIKDKVHKAQKQEQK